MSFQKFFSIFVFLLLLCNFSCRPVEKKQNNPPLSQNDFQNNLSLNDKISKAAYILVAEVVRVESWKKSQDKWVLTLKPEKILKGSPTSSLKVFVPKLFPTEDLPLKEGERALILLEELPSYTAWKDLIEGGVRYGLLGNKEGVVETAADISFYSAYIGQILGFEKIKDEDEKDKKLKAYLMEFLSKNPAGVLATEVTESYFRHFAPLNLQSSDLDFWLSRLKDPNFSSAAKIIAIKQLTTVQSSAMHEMLKQLFCLPPTEMCLRVAESLESQGIELPYYEYESSIQKGPTDLSVGLLVILARHQRKDTFAIFEKYLKAEKSEKEASTLVEALGDFQTPEAEPLVLSYAKDPRYYVRIAVATSLGKLKSTRGIPVLETYLQTKDPSMVTVTAQALKQIGTPKALETLGKYYEMGHHGHWEPVEGPQHFNLPPANP